MKKHNDLCIFLALLLFGAFHSARFFSLFVNGFDLPYLVLGVLCLATVLFIVFGYISFKKRKKSFLNSIFIIGSIPGVLVMILSTAVLILYLLGLFDIPSQR